MARILRRAHALDDLIAHWSYRARQRDTASADALIDRIEQRLELLAQFPESGTPRDDLRPGLRFVTLGTLNLYYNPLRDGIELVRVIDGRRDVQTVFAEEPDDDAA